MGSDYGASHMADTIDFDYRPATVPPMSTIGSRIRDLRKAKELTQPVLAKAIGIDQSTLSDIERGASFRADVLIRLSEALGSTAEYIMTGEDAGSWPFALIPLARFTNLTEKQQGIVEGRLLSAIEECERGPAPAVDLSKLEVPPLRRPVQRKAA